VANHPHHDPHGVVAIQLENVSIDADSGSVIVSGQIP
jgi:hypothetical protein